MNSVLAHVAPRGIEAAHPWGIAARFDATGALGGNSRPATRALTVISLLPAHRPRRLAHADHACRRPTDNSIGGHVPGDHSTRADDAVLTDADPAQDARAVADPHVVPDAHVALVDALLADRPVDFGDAVVEVDQHHAVGNDALAPDRDV